ncbi:MAG: endo-1,4-beta-xylanase [Armatimonadota bacterium]|nr:endo-1,4-beta-xylanase [Armatimonadota bacterium]
MKRLPARIIMALLSFILLGPIITSHAQESTLAVNDEAKLLAETEARILENRTGPLTVRVVDADSRPVVNQKVQVEHMRHLFKFGAGFDGRLLPGNGPSAVDAIHRDYFLKLFNYSTVKFHWRYYEQVLGGYDDNEKLRHIRWLKENGIVARGHPLFWNRDVPEWLEKKNYSATSVRTFMDARLDQLAQTILPELHDVDVINELSRWEDASGPLLPAFAGPDKIPVATHYLKEVKRLAPQVQTVINDSDTSYRLHDLLKELIANGAPVDMIALKNYGRWPPAFTWNVLNQLSDLKKPILIAEFSVASGISGPNNSWEITASSEAAHADYIEQFYKLVYSHPAAAGIVYWNFSDRGAWPTGSPQGLVHEDGTPKPAYARLFTLINETWRTRGEFSTNEKGEVTIPHAYEGEYKITCRDVTGTGEHRATAPLNLVLKKMTK